MCARRESFHESGAWVRSPKDFRDLVNRGLPDQTMRSLVEAGRRHWIIILPKTRNATRRTAAETGPAGQCHL